MARVRAGTGAAGPARRVWQFLVPLIFAAAGVLFATSAVASKGTDLRGGERGDLTDVVRAEQVAIARQADAVQHLRNTVDELNAAAASGSRDAGKILAAARRRAVAAQLEALQGPGVRVTLRDAPLPPGGTLPDGVQPDDLVVHQQDLQAVVNALWAGGGEGLQIMDQRIIATSAVRCVGNVLILQGQVYSPPFAVTAVGNVAGMLRALQESPALDAYRLYVDKVGLGYQVEELGTVTLPAYSGGLDLRSATVASSATSLPAATTSGRPSS